MPEISALRKDPHFQTFAQGMRFIDYWKPCGLPDECDLYGEGVACR
jgi:phytoene/squalene synthetase